MLYNGKLSELGFKLFISTFTLGMNSYVQNTCPFEQNLHVVTPVSV